MNGFRKFMNTLAIMGAAGRVANACENNRAPRAADLRALGIDPRAFTSIGHG